MPEPIVVIPAVRILSIKEDRTLAEIKESIRQSYDKTHQRLRAEAGAAFPRVNAVPFDGVLTFNDSPPIPDEIWEAATRMVDEHPTLFGLPLLPAYFNELPMNFVDDVNALRDEIREKDNKVQALMKHDVFDSSAVPHSRFGEMRANVQLAHRHLEDARMRLGKAIQAFEGRDIFDVPKIKELIADQRRITE